jgi:hypothetical protein
MYIPAATPAIPRILGACVPAKLVVRVDRSGSVRTVGCRRLLSAELLQAPTSCSCALPVMTHAIAFEQAPQRGTSNLYPQYVKHACAARKDSQPDQKRARAERPEIP